MKTAAIVTVFVIFGILHQDFWNWDDSSLVLGFMPVGLAYHASYSVIAAILWALVIKFAWPTRLEEWAEGEDAD
tara:strand:+ start:2559 stop:2780 length:222 start_codon:yes stop_codon:yes gene_type:complete